MSEETKYMCQEGSWFTEGDCPNSGSSDCPLLFSDAKCYMTKEERDLLLGYKNAYYEKQAEKYRSTSILGS